MATAAVSPPEPPPQIAPETPVKMALKGMVIWFCPACGHGHKEQFNYRAGEFRCHEPRCRRTWRWAQLFQP